MDRCSVGLRVESECNQKKQSPHVQSCISVGSLNAEEQGLLHLRVADVCQDVPILETICTFHKNKYILNYSTYKKSCCNVFQVHKKAIRNKILQTISLDMNKEAKKSQLPLKIVPGKKMCSNCRMLHKMVWKLLQPVVGSNHYNPTRGVQPNVTKMPHFFI